MTAIFDGQLLAEYEWLIIELINQLPDEFREGASFLLGINDKDGVRWTGFHQVVERLFLLGLAIGKIKEFFPREYWDKLPGGMPYYQLTT